MRMKHLNRRNVLIALASLWLLNIFIDFALDIQSQGLPRIQFVLVALFVFVWTRSKNKWPYPRDGG